jgi:hypothetical protein
MKIISQKIIFQASRIINPPSDFILGKSRYACADDTTTEHGKGIFNIPVIPTESRKTRITHIFSSVAANTSEISKQVSPSVEIGIYAMSDNNLSLFDCFSEEEITGCNLSLNDDPLTLDNLNAKSFHESNYAKTPDNIVSFNSVSNPISANSNELLFFPYRLANNKPSIVNKLNHVYSIAYDSNIQINTGIELPSQTKYIVLLPFVSVPIPPSRFRISIGKISVSILLNMILEDE